jgi:DNA-binding beta-propeller fold protein YncE
VAVSDVALITHRRGQRTLTLVNVGRPRRPVVLYRLDRQGSPRDVAEQPDSANAFVTFWGSGRVAGIDWGTRRIRFNRAVGAEASTLTFDVFAGDRLWVADPRMGRLVLVSAKDGTVRRRVGGCPGVHTVVQGGTAWIAATCTGSDALAVWHTSRWERRLVPIDGEPRGAAVAVLP